MRYQTIRQDSGPYGWGALLSLLAVVYLTLLPFEFREVALAEAWRQFLAMEPGRVRSSARQQWVANALMFLPLGFFLTAWLTVNLRSLVARLLLVILVCGFCLLVTMAVEFGQIWLAYRNPSLNDISANFVGGVIGAMIWLVAAWRVAPLVMVTRRDGLRISARQALTLYAVFYVVVSLLPFDFFLSLSELRGRFESAHWSWWMRADHCGETFIRCVMLDVSKYLLAVPLGLWLYRLFDGRRVTLVLLAAVAFGVAVEAAQFLLVTGRADGLSGLLRAVGVVSGVLLAPALARFDIRRLRSRWGRTLAILLVVPYGLVVVAVALGFEGYHRDLSLAREPLQSLRLLPFYYHYFVPEAVAIRSVLLNLMLYAPVGGLLWLWTRADRTVLAALLGALFALTVETAKLFVDGLRPDPTSVWIGGAAAWAAWRVCVWISTPHGSAPLRHSGAGRNPVVADSADPGPVSWPARVIGALLLAATLSLAVTWPIAAPWLIVALIFYAIWLWRQPAAWLLVIPVLVPTLNLSLYTGRFFFDELDLFLLATVAVIALRWRGERGIAPLPRPVALALALFALSVAIGLVRSLFPLPPMDANALVHYTSQYNALRDAKGFFWALLLFVLLRQSVSPVEQLLRRWFVPGMVLGLAGAVAVILWERAVYPGLLDFARPYRITGMFTDMHVGGPSIETYLVMATPFVLLWAWQRTHSLWLLPALGLLAGALYGLIVTYSRAGYLGMAVALGVMLVAALAGTVALRGALRWRLAAVAVLPLVVAVAVLPRVTGEVVEQRMGQLEADFEQRLDHWRLVMELREPGVLGAVFGSGPGSFPRAYAWGNPEGRIPANFAYAERPDGTVLRIGTGDSLYINQRISLPHDGVYSVEVNARAEPRARLVLFVCEKPVRYSFTCKHGTVRVPGHRFADEPLLWRFEANELGSGPWYTRRQLVFSFTNGTDGSVIEIERLSLRSADGRELLRNGDFSRGARHWYFTTDHLWPWRTENQWLEIFFALGWPGLLGFVALTGFGMAALLRRAVRGGFADACLLAVLAGTLAIGLFSMVFWSPRLALLFYLVLLLGVAAAHERSPRGPAAGTTVR